MTIPLHCDAAQTQSLTIPNVNSIWRLPAFSFRLDANLVRDTSATLLLAQGVHPKIVQERLGHADIAMTLNRSRHVTPDMQRSAADTLDAAFTMVS